MKKDNLAPIVLFVYNRPWHTKQTIEALKKNEFAKDSVLYIFSDGPKNKEDELKVKEVRKYVNKISGFKNIEIIENKENLGLANSVIKGVTKIVNKFGRVIVLEDDVASSKSFLIYANFLLVKYENDNSVFSITGYNPPPNLMKIPNNYPYDIYFCPRAGSQIWATWKDQWNKVDWKVKDFNEFRKNKNLQKKFNFSGADKTNMLIRQMEGEIDSWAIRWDYAHFKHHAYCIYPVKSYINNIGHDGSGTHSIKSRRNKFIQDTLNNNSIPKLPSKIELNNQLMKNFKKVYKTNIFKKILFKMIKKTKLYSSYKRLVR